jgi:hypothetical protein
MNVLKVNIVAIAIVIASTVMISNMYASIQKLEKENKTLTIRTEYCNGDLVIPTVVDSSGVHKPQ